MTDLGPTEFGTYIFPAWADALGWLMGASTLAPFIFFLIYRLIKEPMVSVCFLNLIIFAQLRECVTNVINFIVHCNIYLPMCVGMCTQIKGQFRTQVLGGRVNK